MSKNKIKISLDCPFKLLGSGNPATIKCYIVCLLLVFAVCRAQILFLDHYIVKCPVVEIYRTLLLMGGVLLLAGPLVGQSFSRPEVRHDIKIKTISDP
jgi:hypothetical protein